MNTFEEVMGSDLERRRQALLLEVKKVFADVKKDDGISIREATQSEATYRHTQEELDKIGIARLADTEIRWQDISDDLLRECPDALFWTNRAGFKFLLPAYLYHWLERLSSYEETTAFEFFFVTQFNFEFTRPAEDRDWLTLEQWHCMKNFVDWLIECDFRGADTDRLEDWLARFSN